MTLADWFGIARIKKTKGNRFAALSTASNTLRFPHTSFGPSTQKLLELEYGYAKDAALMAIQQRAGMMRVYIAIIGVAVAGAFAILREGISANSLFVVELSAVFLMITSLYFMRGLILLRSDWHDYVMSMAAIKVFLIRLEKPELRNEIRTQALMHDPLNPPSRNLKTNFFYHSFLLCGCVGGMATFGFLLALIEATIIPLNLQLWFTSTLLFASLALTLTLAVALAGLWWDSALLDDREAVDRSPLDRAA